MASSGKRKTTMQKLMREAKLRERRADKDVRKQARRRELEHPSAPVYGPAPADLDAAEPSELG